MFAHLFLWGRLPWFHNESGNLYKPVVFSFDRMTISHNREVYYKRGRNRKKRSKSFSTKEAAAAWAKKQGIEKYTLRSLTTATKKRQKIIVVQITS